MFEELHLIGDTTQSIVLQTRKGRDVRNAIAPEPGGKQVAIYGLIRAQFGALWKQRKPACGGYNCFGHLFASRRTAVHDDAEIQKIFEDDGIRKLRPDEWPQVDDLVLYSYLQGRTRKPFHVARITKVESLVIPEQSGGALMKRTPILTVVSKWNDSAGEDEHKWRDIGLWENLDLDLEAEVFTERV